jgi:hypothetical protein
MIDNKEGETPLLCSKFIDLKTIINQIDRWEVEIKIDLES